MKVGIILPRQGEEVLPALSISPTSVASFRVDRLRSFQTSKRAPAGRTDDPAAKDISSGPLVSWVEESGVPARLTETRLSLVG